MRSVPVKCNLCDTGSYVGYTRGQLYARVDGHKSTSSSVRKHYDNDHMGAVPEDLLSCFKVLKKCMNKFDCLVNEMLCYININLIISYCFIVLDILNILITLRFSNISSFLIVL